METLGFPTCPLLISYLTPNLLVSLAFPLFKTRFIYFLLCIYTCTHACLFFIVCPYICIHEWTCTPIHMCGGGERTTLENVFSLLPIQCPDWTHIVSLSSRHLCFWPILLAPSLAFQSQTATYGYICSVPTCDLQSDTKSPNHTLVISEFILHSDRKFMRSDLSSFNRKIKVFCPLFFLGKMCQKDRHFWCKKYLWILFYSKIFTSCVWMFPLHVCMCNMCLSSMKVRSIEFFGTGSMDGWKPQYGG